MTSLEDPSLAVGLAAEDDGARWDAFVERAAGSSLCHLHGWSRVFERTYRKRCFYLCAEGRSGIEGILPLVVMRGAFGAGRLVSVPFLDQGGLVATSRVAAQVLVRKSLDLANELGVAGIDLRGGCHSWQEEGAETDRFRLVLTLPDTQEELWQKVGPKVRNQIRKSEKAGLATESVPASELGAFYTIFGRNMRDLGSPVHSRRLFTSILDEFGSRAILYLTRDAAGRPVAGAVALRFASSFTVPWASSLQSARPQCPNHSLYSRILSDAVDQGLASFDFGRSTAGTGTFHFKKQWNAEAVPLHWCSLDRSGQSDTRQYLSSQGNPLLAKSWRLLPLPVANVLGPVIRGRLAN